MSKDTSQWSTRFAPEIPDAPCRCCGKFKPINVWCDCPEALKAQALFDEYMAELYEISGQAPRINEPSQEAH
jgi:hypothetical protein